MSEKAQIWLRCVTVGLLLSATIGLGEYALAPGGQWVDVAMQTESHDWHTYQWFFQGPVEILLELSLLMGLVNSVLVLPFAALFAAILSFALPKLGARFLQIRSEWLYTATSIIGIALGVANTIHAGKNPGML
jgi:hypothetical protein